MKEIVLLFLVVGMAYSITAVHSRLCAEHARSANIDSEFEKYKTKPLFQAHVARQD